jgi:hypothetical protein
MQNITTIKLYSNSTYPSDPTGGYLEVDDKTTIPLNFAIADIRDISKKKGVFSKSITIPGTKNNNKILNNYFDVNIKAGTFDINKLQLCSIIQNGVIILDNALLQLVSVNKSQQNSSYEDNVTYTLLVKDQTSDFFTTINNKLLSDLDFSELNHLYTGSNVANSFYNTLNNGYKYVMPYNSPDLDNVGADAIFDLVEFAPAIYANKYWDKIFANSGYSYNWVGITASDTRFHKLVIPYNGDVVRTTKEDSVIYTATAQRTTSSTHSTTLANVPMSIFSPIDTKTSIYSNTTYVPIIPNIQLSDPNNNYDPVTGVYTTPFIPSNQNNVKVDYTIEYETIVQNNNGFTVYHVGFYNPQYPSIRTTTDYAILPTNYKREVKPIVRLMNNTNVAYSDILNSGSPTYINQKQSFAAGKTILNSGTMSFSNTIFGLTPNVQIYLDTAMNVVNSPTGTPNVYLFYSTFNPVLKTFNNLGSTTPLNNVFIQNVIKSITIKFTCELDGEVSYNVPLNMNKFIPQQIKQSDFIKGILTMYNLYVEVDKDLPSRLNIISRDNYYDSGKIVDWTKKLIKDKPQELKFIPEITNKKTILTYKQDEDWANKRYKSATNEIYGQAEYIFDNEYVKDVTTIELLFSPTPVANTSFGAICPIWNGQAPQTNIRILYDGGAKTCGQYQIINYYDPTTGASVSTTTNVYPLITHWDRQTNPTFDLNFLPCDFYFRSDNWGSDTNNNLFNLNWRRTMNQINTGKLLTAYFNLNSYDIVKMKLNDKIRIDNSWWFINSIKDYDANSLQPTKVELISVDDEVKIPFIVQNAVVLGRNSPYFSVLNDLAASKQRYSNTIISTGDIDVVGRNNYIGDGVTGKVIGSDNSVSSGNTFVFGNENTIDTNSSFVIGSNNTVLSNVENSIVIGTEIIATQSNTLYAANVVIQDGGTINNQPINNIVGLWEADTVNPGVINAITGYDTLVGGSAGTSVDNATTDSIAWGNNVEITGAYSAGFGLDTLASDNAIVAGDGCNAGPYSAAFGQFSVASGIGSVAMGMGNNATGDASFSSGEANGAVGDFSSSTGYYNTVNSFGETVIGHFSENVAGSDTSIDPDDTVFRVGIGTAVGSRLDAFRVYKNSAIKLNPVTTASIGSPVVGMTIFNSTNNSLNIHNGSTFTNTDASPIVKKYIAIINCNTSTATVLFNTLGVTPTITCGVVGAAPSTVTTNINTASAQFTASKTFITYTPVVLTGAMDSHGGFAKVTNTTNVDISLQALDGANYLANVGLHVEITVYP